jgi:hypothetical protein
MEGSMDGAYNQEPGQLARLLAEAQRSRDGLTHLVFESLVRAVWQMNQGVKEADVLQVVLEAQLASLGGLNFAVKSSHMLPGAIDVTGSFCHTGMVVTHTVHLW